MNAKHPFRKILDSKMPEEFQKRVTVSAVIPCPDYDDLSYVEEPLKETEPLTLSDEDWIDI